MSGERFRKQGRRFAGFLAMLTLLFLGVVEPAAAINFKTDGSQVLRPNVSGAQSTWTCPTLESAPAPLETYFNLPDMEVRGYYDPTNNEPWNFATKTAQIICGAKAGSQIKLGMYFIRALGTMDPQHPWDNLGDRPETDPQVIYDALEYVKKVKGVSVGIVLDGGSITPLSAKSLINTRLVSSGIAKIYWCKNGCFNTNRSSVYPFAINHEKFITISDTIWESGNGPHPAVFSSSGNFARSQVRNYMQEASLIYNDKKMFEQFSARYDGMISCAASGCSSTVMAKLQLKKQRGIWVDPIYRHYTDAGRGTTVSFSPATYDARDYYVQQFDDVDCTVDKKIRIAMFKLTDSKAEQMVKSLVRLRKRGCDIKMLLTQQGGATAISPKVVRMLRGAKIWTMCTAVAMHTKIILIGPMTSNSGRVLYGTANMSTSGLRYSEEHTITLDTRRANATYAEHIRRVYGEYLTGWYELSATSKACK